MLEERGVDPDIGTLLYTKNTALDRNEESGNLRPPREFSVGQGPLAVRRPRAQRPRVARRVARSTTAASAPPSRRGYEADAKCQYCFEQDTCMVVSGRLDQGVEGGFGRSPVPTRERDYFDRFVAA